jgi:hypothetical protein
MPEPAMVLGDYLAAREKLTVNIPGQPYLGDFVRSLLLAKRWYRERV